MFLNSKNKSSDYLRIDKIVVYKTDVVIEYKNYNGTQEKQEKGTKNALTMLSRKSLKKLAFYAQNTAVDFVSFVTLTYPNEWESDGKKVKGHLNRFLSWTRARWKGIGYLWFMEFQKRGAPHFHLMTDRKMTDSMKDISLFWYKAVGSGDEKHLRAGTNTQDIRDTNGAAKYAAKYASKQKQKAVPKKYRNCGRFWGCSRNVKPEPTQMFDSRGMVGSELMETMRILGWEYYKSLTIPLSTLYNAAILFNQST